MSQPLKSSGSSRSGGTKQLCRGRENEMSRTLRAIAVAITASAALPAYAGEGGGPDDFRLPPATENEPEPRDDDDGPVLPPWQRPDAVEPEAGVDDDPTTFDPDAGPTAPEPD
jgi:hypothetical protein